MAIVGHFTPDTSDITITPPSSAPDTVNDQGGGHVTYVLGENTSANNTTISFTPTGTANDIYRCGSFVTTPAPPNRSGITRQFTTTTDFFVHRIYGYESASNVNAYFCFRIGRLKYTPGTGDVETDHTYEAISNGWVVVTDELGTGAASQDQYGSGPGVGSGGSELIPVNSAREILEDDRLMVEWGIKVTSTQTSQVHFEFGGLGDQYTNAASGVSLAYGSEIVVPMNFTEEYDGHWGPSQEITATRGSEISWANIAAARTYQSADWSDASRYVTRRSSGSNITAQMWAKTDDEFLYVMANNIIDGCIQASDHHRIYICSGASANNVEIPQGSSYEFSIDINGKESQTDNPSAISEGGGTEDGPRILRGDADGTSFPYGWQEAIWHTGSASHTVRGAEFRAVDNAATDTDAFTNTDSTALPTHNAKWVAYQYTVGTMEINTNSAKGLSAQTDEGGYRNTTATGLTDCAAEVDWAIATADSTWQGIMLRIDTGLGGDHYEFRFAAQNRKSLSAAVADDGGSQTNETTAANNATASDMTLTPVTPAVDDAYYFGYSSAFPFMSLNIATAATGTYTLVWEYWDENSWELLPDLIDDTNSFGTTGTNDISWTVPSDWATTTINAQGPYYYIRARVSAYTTGVGAIGTQAWINEYNAEIRRFDSGSPTTLRQAAVPRIGVETVRVRAECYGTQTKLYFNGRTMAEYNDAGGSGISNSGQSGIFMTNNNNSFDNWNFAAQDDNFPTEFWEEGVDFRMASETSGTTTAPDPNTDDVSTVSKSARCTFKIRKRRLNGWNGYQDVTFMINMQCDVQGQGNTTFPGALANQLDKPGWNYWGFNYGLTDQKTVSGSAASGSAMVMQPLMGGHIHDGDPYEFYITGLF
jgi:hypothetical protein